MSSFHEEMALLLPPFVARLKAHQQPGQERDFEFTLLQMERAVADLFGRYAEDFVTTLSEYLAFNGSNENARYGDDPGATVASMACNASRILSDLFRLAIKRADVLAARQSLPDPEVIAAVIADLRSYLERSEDEDEPVTEKWDA